MDNFSLQIRTELEMQMVCNLREFKEFIDNEMIVILGQMDSPTEIFDHVYLVGLPSCLYSSLKRTNLLWTLRQGCPVLLLEGH